jgi:small subunit ribosomal protein S6e
MAEFKVVIADVKTGKTYNRDVGGQNANALIGKKIGDEIDGNFVDLPFFKLKITGGSDKSGIPMRQDLHGSRRKRVLLTEGVGFHPEDDGVRMKKTVRGNTINPDIIQINMKIVKHGPKKIEDSFAEKKEEGKDAEEEGK